MAEESLQELEGSRLAFLKALLTEHLEDENSASSEEIDNCDLTVIDGHASGLVSMYLKMEGDLEKLDSYYSKVKISNKFTDLVIDVYAITDKVLSRLTERDSKAYFERLKLMASIMLDISLPDKENEEKS